MIVVQLLGGLGNQMFQYAAARRLAIEKSVELKLDVSAFDQYLLRKYELGCFELDAEIADASDLQPFLELKKDDAVYRRKKLSLLLRNRPQNYDEKEWYHFEKAFLKTSRNVYLRGYFQHENYFKPIESRIRADFKIKAALTPTTQALSKQIQGSNSISIHIRRGDYANNPETENFHGLLPLEYYHAAVQQIVVGVDQPHFFIFSDDSLWAHQHLDLQYPCVYVMRNDSDHAYEDLHLMSLCRHHIIANSSFSWWGAWCGEAPDKMVYAPKAWIQSKNRDASQITPPSWIRL